MRERYDGDPSVPPQQHPYQGNEKASLGEYEEISSGNNSHDDTGLRKSFNGINAVRWLHAKHLQNEEEEAQKRARSPPPRKVGVLEFILTQHSLLALCFNKNSPPPIMAGCCCVDLSDITDGRQRAFVSLFALLLTCTSSLCMSMVHYNDYIEAALTTVFLLPVILFIKSHIVTFSEWVNGPELQASLFGCVRIEEGILLLLFLGLGGLLYEVGYVRGDEGQLVSSLQFSLYVYGITFVMEIVQLVFQFFCCRSCCPCCVPTKAELIYYERFNAQREELTR